MRLSQFIYTSTCTAEMTAKMAYQVSCQSVSVCEQLGLTGRVFANSQQAFSVTEGPTELVQRYYTAVKNDVLVGSILLHVERRINTREFKDYSVWLNVPGDEYVCSNVYPLTRDSVVLALPDNPSTRLRIMAEAYLAEEMLSSYAV